MRRLMIALLAASAAALAAEARALSLAPLTSFSGDGWLSPAEDGNLTTDNTQRGLAYHGASDTVYVVDRNGGLSVNLYNGTTGAPSGSLDVTGVAGGLFPLNVIDTADDGTIYAAALATSGDAFVWRWANAAATPTLAFQGTFTGLGRLGDSIAVIGSGTDTRIAVSGSGSDGVLILDTADGSTFTATGVSPITNVPAGGMRLGLDFIDSGTLIGEQTIPPNAPVVLYTADIASATGAAFAKNSSSEAPLGYYSDGAGTELLATVDITSSSVRLYDATDLTLLTTTGFLDIANNLGGTASVANGNGVGNARFGVAPDGSLRLYALNTNNGIQAFEVVPEPAALALALVSFAGVALARRRRG